MERGIKVVYAWGKILSRRPSHIQHLVAYQKMVYSMETNDTLATPDCDVAVSTSTHQPRLSAAPPNLKNTQAFSDLVSSEDF